MTIPGTLQYTKGHEWIQIENGEATIGITDYAQGELGDIIYIEFPDTGDKFNAGDSIGTIEAVKTVADLFTPLAGEISKINLQLEDEPEAINKDPYESGWIIKLKNITIEGKSQLLTASEYKKYIN